MFAIFAILFYLSESLELTYHFKGVARGGLLAIPLSALCLASYLTGKWIGERKQLMKWLSVSGMVGLAVVLFVCGMFTPSGLVVLLALIGIGAAGIGILLPCMDALITEGIRKEERGTVTSLYSSMRFLGVAIGPPAASLLIGKGTLPLFYTVSAVSGFTVLLILYMIKPYQGPNGLN